MINYLIENWIELVVITTGVSSTLYLAKENRWGWFLDVVNSVFLVYVAFCSKLYASSMSSVFFAVTSTWAFIKWKGGSTKNSNFKLARADKPYKIKIGSIMLAVFTVVFAILKIFTQANSVVLDSFNTSLKVTSQLARIDKKVEGWSLTMAMNFIGVIIYMKHKLYITALLYIMYFILNTFGYIKWIKKIKGLRKQEV